MPSIVSQKQSNSQASAYERDQAQWYFKVSDFEKTPSRVEGMSAAEEANNRRKGITFINQVGLALKLDQTTLATAAVYFQRFYMRHPLQIGSKGVHHYQIAATAVYLAYKSKENPRKMHELIVAVSRVAQKDNNLMIDEQSKEYWRWRDSILHHENLMLEALCLDLDILLPHIILYDYIRFYNVHENKILRNTLWAFVNDTCLTTLCLLVRPQVIAGSALYVAAKLSDVRLPDDEHGRPWWEQLELDIFDMQLVINTMADTYEDPTVSRHAPPNAYVKDVDMMSFDLTRMASPHIDQSEMEVEIEGGRERPGYGSGSEEGELG